MPLNFLILEKFQDILKIFSSARSRILFLAKSSYSSNLKFLPLYPRNLRGRSTKLSYYLLLVKFIVLEI